MNRDRGTKLAASTGFWSWQWDAIPAGWPPLLPAVVLLVAVVISLCGCGTAAVDDEGEKWWPRV